MSALVFTYKAVDGMGVPSKGELKASSSDDAKQQLSALGLKPMEVAEKKSAFSADFFSVSSMTLRPWDTSCWETDSLDAPLSSPFDGTPAPSTAL